MSSWRIITRASAPHHAPERDDAFTLVELLVSVAILGFVLGVTFLLLTSVQSMASRLDAHAAATDEARQAVDVMTRELRMAQTPPTGNWGGALYVGNAQDRRLSFWADVTRDGTVDLVTYKVVGNSLVRTLTPLVTQTTLGTEGAPRTLVATLGASTPIFSYFDKTPTELTTGGGTSSLDSSEIAACVAVELDVTAAADDRTSHSTQTARLDTWVRLRSIDAAIGN